MRKACAAVFAAVLLLGLVTATPARQPDPETTAGVAASPVPTADKALLWEITAADAEPSFLFGTIHSEDPRVLDLPAAVERALRESQSFTMEVLLDELSADTATISMVFADDRTLATVTGADLAHEAIELLTERGIPPQLGRRLKPWAAMMTLSVPPPKTGLFLDMTLYLAAKRQGKRVFGLETINEQLESLDGIPMAEQVVLLQETIASYPALMSMLDKMIAAYLARDLSALVDLSHEFGPQDAKARDVFMSRLINQRNHRLTDRMIPRLEEGNAFIAVGALHLPGSDGVLQLLRERGYTVTAAY